MRRFFLCYTGGSLLVSLLGGCNVTVTDGDSGVPPMITTLRFPATIPGDGSTQLGTVSFRDEDGGVFQATLETLECPPDWTCGGTVVDLRNIDQSIPDMTTGSFDFPFSCTNSWGEDGTVVWQFTLEDLDGNESQPKEVSVICEAA